MVVVNLLEHCYICLLFQFEYPAKTYGVQIENQSTMFIYVICPVSTVKHVKISSFIAIKK